MSLIKKKTGGHRDGRITFRSAANHRSHNKVLIFQWSSVHTHTSIHASLMHPTFGPRDTRTPASRDTVQRRRTRRERPRQRAWRPLRRAQWRNLHGCKRFSFHASYAGMTGSQSARPPTLPQAYSDNSPPPFPLLSIIRDPFRSPPPSSCHLSRYASPYAARLPGGHETRQSRQRFWNNAHLTYNLASESLNLCLAFSIVDVKRDSNDEIFCNRHVLNFLCIRIHMLFTRTPFYNR